MVSRELEKECVVVFDEAHNIDNVCIEVRKARGQRRRPRLIIGLGTPADAFELQPQGIAHRRTRCGRARRGRARRGRCAAHGVRARGSPLRSSPTTRPSITQACRRKSTSSGWNAALAGSSRSR